MPREINEAGYRLIKEFEAGPQLGGQPALTAYRCPAGTWTIGWGHTGPDVVPGTTVTLEGAQALLERDLDGAESCVERAATRSPNENEFAAMVALAFNVGTDGFKASTVLRRHNLGDRAGAAAAFGLWRKMRDPVTGQLVDSPGLIRRRHLEAGLYLTPVNADAAAMPQAVAPPPPAAASRTVIAGGVAVATGAASLADQIDQVAPLLDSLTTAGLSVQNLLKLGGAALSFVAVAAVAYMLWRYLQKRRRGEVLST
ncbi:MAG: lysozyme [Pseudomonadota bacterium]